MNPVQPVTKGSPLFPAAVEHHRVFGGLSKRQEQVFKWIAMTVVVLYAAAWVGAFDHLRAQRRQLLEHSRAARAPVPAPLITPSRQIATALSGVAPATAYIDDAMLSFLNPLRGASGKLRFATRTAGAPIVAEEHGRLEAVLSAGKATEVSPEFVAPKSPGVYKLAVQLDKATRAISDFSVITLVPFSQKHSGRIGLYYLGSWPFERGGTPKTAAYANPSGFIEVTRQNQDTLISAHFRLRDFLTKTQYQVWPKYLLLNPRLLDKLELTIDELERTGHPVRNMHVMSGFRTPEYNATGGNKQGRANLSRHMYGDASDVFVDNDGNGMMDDLNGDGRVDARDAEVILQAVDTVERSHPELVGGVGVYSACCGHGPFTHVDVRGYRARWRGTTGG